MKNIINLLLAGTLVGCTNNVKVVSYKEIEDSDKPKKTYNVPTKYGFFELKEYEKGSEIRPLGGFNSIKPLRDIDGDWNPDEVKYDGDWVAIEKKNENEFGEIYKSVHLNAN